MRPPIRSATAVLVLSVLACGPSVSCSKREFVRRTEDRIAFHSFIFLKTGSQTWRLNGNTVIVRGALFKMRVSDNLLNRHLFDYVCAADGLNRVVIPSRSVVHRRFDPDFSRVLTEYVFDLFRTVDGGRLPEDEKLTDFFLENGRIKYILFLYHDRLIRLDVLKRSDDGTPRRIRIRKEPDEILFDIVGFEVEDFPVEDRFFRIVEQPGGTFFDWIGTLDAQKQD